jgi:hypothetical protein
VKHATDEIYYSYVVDKDTEDCFLIKQDTRKSPK